MLTVIPKQVLPIFVINLKKDNFKKEHMQSMADKYGLEFTFIEAVYGKDLDQEKVDEICDHSASNRILNRELFRGEIGVALSQMSIYQKMIDENIQEAVIFEDDVIVDESLFEVMSSTQNFPEDWELVLLGYHRHFISNKYHRLSLRQRKKISKRFKVARFTDVMDGAFGYIINIQGAKRLLTTLSKGLVEPVDRYTGNSKYINLYGLTPRCVSVDINIGSSINEERFAHWKSSNAKIRVVSKKEKLKQLLNKFGFLQVLQKINKTRIIWQEELAHLPKRLSLPKKYT